MNLEETVRILHELAMQTPQGRAAFTQRKNTDSVCKTCGAFGYDKQPDGCNACQGKPNTRFGDESLEETAEKFLEMHFESHLVTHARVASLAALLQSVRAQEEVWEDAPDEWTDAIKAAFPTRSGSHDQYGIAMEMVSHRHSKSELVALVNWLLVRSEGS